MIPSDTTIGNDSDSPGPFHIDFLDVVATQGAYLISGGRTPVWPRSANDDEEFVTKLRNRLEGHIRIALPIRARKYGKAAAHEWPCRHTPPRVVAKYRKGRLRQWRAAFGPSPPSRSGDEDINFNWGDYEDILDEDETDRSPSQIPSPTISMFATPISSGPIPSDKKSSVVVPDITESKASPGEERQSDKEAEKEESKAPQGTKRRRDTQPEEAEEVVEEEQRPTKKCSTQPQTKRRRSL